eukprot:8147682-Pyramimonas_sp.AAC.1
MNPPPVTMNPPPVTMNPRRYEIESAAARVAQTEEELRVVRAEASDIATARVDEFEEVYSLSPPAIGACHEYILFPLLRLVRDMGCTTIPTEGGIGALTCRGAIHSLAAGKQSGPVGI